MTPTPPTIPHELLERVQGYADRLGQPRDAIITDAILGLLTHPSTTPCEAHHGLGLIAQATDPSIDPDGTLTEPPVCAVYCTTDPTWKAEIIDLLAQTIEAIKADPS